MTGVAHHVAGASLPVAVGLLVLALAARLALWAPADDARVRAAASEYLAPLCTWCLIATGVYAVALGATGEAGVLAFAVAAVIAGAALALHGSEPAAGAGRPPAPRAEARPEPPAAPAARPAPAPTAAPAPRPVPAAAPTAAPAPAAAPRPIAPAAGRSLWAEPEDDARTGLWSR